MSQVYKKQNVNSSNVEDATGPPKQGAWNETSLRLGEKFLAQRPHILFLGLSQLYSIALVLNTFTE